jgi:hypothetical protein
MAVPACKAAWEAGLERFRLLAIAPDACSWLGAGKLGFSLVCSATLRGICPTQKENLSGMTYHEFVLCGKFWFRFDEDYGAC